MMLPLTLKTPIRSDFSGHSCLFSNFSVYSFLTSEAYGHPIASFWFPVAQTYAEITSDEYLKFISKYVVGLGPWKDTIVPPNEKNYLATPTDLIKRAHAHNLQVLTQPLWSCVFCLHRLALLSASALLDRKF